MSISPGTRLGSYVVQDFIGQGAMGVVYRAYHAELERVAAVKVLQGLATDPDSSARFRREAQAIAHLRHPNVLNVFDFGEYQGTPYMIVEFVEGGSLSARLKRSPIDQDSALRYLQGIGEALDYAHSHGIVHRDVKPANVLLGPDDTPILADFGLVKLMQSSSIVSLTGVTTGTPAYMAPEQVSGHDVGPAADRYAFAVMAYEMLTGSYPFDEPGVLEVLYAHVHKEPPAPSTRKEGLGPRADAVLLRGLAKDPDARWESCDVFVTALTQSLGLAPAVAERTVVMAPPAPAGVAAAVAVAPARTEPAVKTKPIAPAAAAATVFAPLPKPPTPEKERRRRRTVFAIGAAVLLLLLLTGGVFVFEANKPTLDVSPRIATYGQQVVVTATHVPANQAGEIRLESVLHRYSFTAGGDGKVTQDLVVPYDVETGDHHLLICWNGQCPAQTTLKVVAGVAEVSPLPGQSPTSTPSQSPSPGTSPTSRPTGGSSPRPGVTPNPTPTHQASPPPPPPPSTNPCPTPAGGATLTPGNQALVPGGTTWAQRGSNFTPNKLVVVHYYRNSVSSANLYKSWNFVVACDGTFGPFNVTAPTGVIETDYLVATDTGGRTKTATISVIL